MQTLEVLLERWLRPSPDVPLAGKQKGNRDAPGEREKQESRRYSWREKKGSLVEKKRRGVGGVRGKTGRTQGRRQNGIR